MLHAIALILVCTQTSQVKPPTTDEASVRKFVQDFYDWYSPLERKFDPDKPMNPQDMVVQSRAGSFNPELLAMFVKGRKHEAGEEAPVGMEIGDPPYEPFLGIDDWNSKFIVGSVKKAGAKYLVTVQLLKDASQEKRAVTAEVEKSETGWRFSNFIYDRQGWNLRDYLHELMPQPASPPKKFYETGGLSASKIQWLKKERVRCVIPTYIPAGMHLDRFAMTPMIEVDDSFVEMTWKGKNGAEFTIEMISDGIGDVIVGPDRPIDPKWFSYRTVRNPVLGRMQVESLDLPSERDFGVNWIDTKSRRFPRFVCLTGEHMPVSEAIKIAKGLRFLK